MDDTFSSLYTRASEALEIADELPESLELFNKALKKANKPVQKAACFRGRSLALQQLGCERYKYAKNENILKSALRDALVAAQLEPQFTDIAQIAQWHIDHKVAASPGTLRWIDAKSPPPKLPVNKKEKSSSTGHGTRLTTGGWKEYLEARAPDLIQAAKRNPAIIDGLSCPLSLAYALQAAQIFPHLTQQSTTEDDGSKSNAARAPSGRRLGLVNIIVLGASEHCEQAVLERTNYWEELGVILGCERLKMWFVGPEMRDHKVETPSFAVTCRKISAPFVLKRFLEAHPEVPESAPVCVFNGGFGNQLPSGGTGHLLHSWLPCLRELTESSRICIFFCANDYADLQGECFMHSQVLGSRFILLPQRNPFSMASVHCSKVPSQGDQELSAENDWFQGNAFVYATQSYDAKRRKPCVDWKRAWSKAQDVAAAQDGNLPGMDEVHPVLPPLLMKISGMTGNPMSSTAAAVKNKSSTNTTQAAPGPAGESTGSYSTNTLMKKEIPSTNSTSTQPPDGKAKTESKAEDASSITAATDASLSTTGTAATTATASKADSTRGHDASFSITASTSSSSYPTATDSIHGAEKSTTNTITPLSSSLEKMEPWAGNGDREEMCEKTVSNASRTTANTKTTVATTAPTAASTATTKTTVATTADTRSIGGSEHEKSKEDGKGRGSGKFTIQREDEEGLVVFFQFDHAHNMHEVDADVSSTHLRLAAPGYETLEFAFSQPINEAGASIKFSKKTKGLTFSAPWKI